MKNIAITGPESTGKSSLAKALSVHFKGNWVPEFARTYIENLNRPYTKADVLYIAKKQIETELSMRSIASEDYLFCDSDMLVCKIWQEYKYGSCDEWIEDKFKQHPYDLILLCDVDLAWEEDPLREHPKERQILFDLYLKQLSAAKKNFRIIQGNGEERLKNAIAAVLGISGIK